MFVESALPRDKRRTPPKSCWSTKTPFQTGLILALMVAIGFLIPLLSLYAHSFFWNKSEKCTHLCNAMHHWQSTINPTQADYPDYGRPMKSKLDLKREEERRKAEEEEEARRKAEEEEERRKAEEARQKAEEEARQKAEEEAKRIAKEKGKNTKTPIQKWFSRLPWVIGRRSTAELQFSRICKDDLNYIFLNSLQACFADFATIKTDAPKVAQVLKPQNKENENSKTFPEKPQITSFRTIKEPPKKTNIPQTDSGMNHSHEKRSKAFENNSCFEERLGFPSIGALFQNLYTDDDEEEMFKCPVAILSSRWVLAAEECLQNDIKALSVRVNSNYWSKGGVVNKVETSVKFRDLVALGLVQGSQENCFKPVNVLKKGESKTGRILFWNGDLQSPLRIRSKYEPIQTITVKLDAEKERFFCKGLVGSPIIDQTQNLIGFQLCRKNGYRSIEEYFQWLEDQYSWQ